MIQFRKVDEVFDAIQKTKAKASDFRTNFFPVPAKLQNWIERDELLGEVRDGATFFFRKDRDFFRFYFCAGSLEKLESEILTLSFLKNGSVATDLVGNETAVAEMCAPLEAAGFSRYAQLQRMARPAQTGGLAVSNLPVVFAEKADAPTVLELIENAFDRFGEQLPALYEIEAAISNRQIFVVKRDGKIAGLLFFETQGFNSIVRFWAVAEKFRALKIGSALMQHYFKTQNAVRRFTLWVNAANENAIQKYKHYGYAPDGLIDCVLANKMIRT
ncbi:MAG TPA: GNAT family N-acetyltransferase [Verrucomicrobiae bacterium]|jgi:ribosomal protein S18 acetylase RimI-like enzyme